MKKKIMTKIGYVLNFSTVLKGCRVYDLYDMIFLGEVFETREELIRYFDNPMLNYKTPENEIRTIKITVEEV